jgi:transposase
MRNDITVFVGLDVHKDSITVACVGSNPAEPPADVGTIGTQQYAIDRLIKKLSGRGPLTFVYEAGPCGFWLQRYLHSVGQQCLVAAPSLIPRRPGVRIKTDRLDARNLALALRAGTLTAVHIPTPEEEAFRDVVRAPESPLAAQRHPLRGPGHVERCASALARSARAAESRAADRLPGAR